ncbi:MAG: methyltransferase domain-containing protein, partial [Gammaproteobacteria bacterium]|nr:methyltransferase domain-containing protein [Gammaproteobacteria bacterium]
MPDLMTLEEIRDRLDLGDTQMLEWLATRANLVREVARIKDAKNASLQAADREASMFAKKQIQCRVHGLDFDYVSEIVSLMIWHSKQIECDELDRDTFLNTEPVPTQELRSQLLKLTEIEAPRYDEFCRGENSDAVSAYLDRERTWLERLCEELGSDGLALDLGCATGQITEFLQGRFSQVRAFDISEHMIAHARERCAWQDSVSFEVCDLDDPIPVADESVNLVVANFGVASELRADLLSEVRRVLKPGGRAFLSYYNRDALVNHWIYPWPATIHSHLNPHNDTLEVWSGDSVFT